MAPRNSIAFSNRRAAPTRCDQAEAVHPGTPDSFDDSKSTSPLAEALARLAEAEDTLRAIGAGEIDAFVVPDGSCGRRVFTLSTADRPYRAFVESMRDGAATLSPAGIILYANGRLAELLSCSRETLLGLPLTTFVSPTLRPLWEEGRLAGGLGTTVELDLIDADGNTIPVLVGISALDVDSARLACLTFTDLSVQKAQEGEITRLGEVQTQRMADLQVAQEALTRQATHDALTGLPNRDLLVDRIDQTLRHASRSGCWTAVYFIDLDSFKQVNDTQGHAAGNGVLRRVADALTAAVRTMDTVARIGGDEFVVLAPDVGGYLQAVDLGLRLGVVLGRHPGGVEQPVDASIGISISQQGRGTADSLLHEADMAMYRAKSLGGGRSEVFDTHLADQMQERATAQHVLQTALNERRIVAFYQPIIDLATGVTSGFEALVRITQLDGTLLTPSSFIAVAENTGLVVPLGTQMLELACGQASIWQQSHPKQPGLSISVNVSSRQFESGDLTTVILRTLRDTGLSADLLHLELTETAIMDLRPDIVRQLGAIRDIGVQIGLDDFGTGYASLTHLRRLPLSFVKIDQSFVQGLGTNHDDEGIVAAVVDLAANLGLQSIGEGVETREQLELLQELGCDHAQGYLFAPPMPPTDIVQQALNQLSGPSDPPCPRSQYTVKSAQRSSLG